MAKRRINIKRGLIRIWLLSTFIWIGVNFWQSFGLIEFLTTTTDWKLSERYIDSEKAAFKKEKEFENIHGLNLDSCIKDAADYSYDCLDSRHRIKLFQLAYLEKKFDKIDLDLMFSNSGEFILPSMIESTLRSHFMEFNWPSILKFLSICFGPPLFLLIIYGMGSWVISGFIV